MNMKTVSFLALLLLNLNQAVMADVGLPIPEPAHSLTQAVQIVDAHFRKNFPDGKRFTESKDFKIKDFFVTKVQYTQVFDEKKLKEWAWAITFQHPIQNDNSFTFQLSRKGEVLLLQQTQ